MSDADDKVEFPEPPSDEDIDARLADQKDRLAAARQRHADLAGKGPIDRETSRGMGIGLSAAYAIIGLPLVGAGLGWLLDRALGTGFFVIVLVVAGLVGGMWHAVQLSNRQ